MHCKTNNTSEGQYRYTSLQQVHKRIYKLIRIETWIAVSSLLKFTL